MPWLTGNSRGPFHEGILEMAYPCGIEGQELVRLDASREAILDAPASSVTGAINHHREHWQPSDGDDGPRQDCSNAPRWGVTICYVYDE